MSNRNIGTYAGLVIDGPAFGRNLEAWHPRVVVPVRGPVERFIPSPASPINEPVFHEVEYVFSDGVWAMGDYLKAWDGWIPDNPQSAREGTGRNMKKDSKGRRWVS